MEKSTLTLCIFFFFFFFSFAQPTQEFRAVWIATVDNIDWPSKGNYNSDSQKLEFIRILDMHKRNGMNAVIAQIRPASDAFYPSPYEPWSEWLTGKQGQPPAPYYDPLQFMIEETHKRGMEFHAWCNPYRAVFRINVSSISSSHITRIHPEWFLTYGDTRYFDPGNKEVQQYVANVIRDIVRRYDIDAVHFDDYFYPYRIAGREFPDNESYQKYGSGINREDWRRSNVDSIIVLLSRVIKEEKKYCKFGISPFGIWRNKEKDPDGSDTHAGQTNYDDLYADIVLWLKNGWIDYVAPQIYFDFDFKAAPYAVLLDWWSRHSFDRHCYIGLGIYRANSSPAWRDRTLLPREIQALRNYPQIQGEIYFSSKSFEKNPHGWNDSLQNNYYKNPAIIPPMSWIDSLKPAKPDSLSITIPDGGFSGALYLLAAHKTNGLTNIRSMLVYASTDKNDVLSHKESALQFIIPRQGDPDIISKSDYQFLNPGGIKKYFIGVSLLSLTNNESDLSNIITATLGEKGNWEFSN
jgi:uncharacterized lipoprotein YddW (UPF0748 family)